VEDQCRSQTYKVCQFSNESVLEAVDSWLRLKQGVEPKLTTFDVKTKEIGEAAARVLLEQIIPKDKLPKTIMIKGAFIQRESTRKVKAGIPK